MGIMKEIRKVRKEVDMMRVFLKDAPDEKLIKGYHDAMRDYKETNNENCKHAAQAIKLELDERGIEVDDEKLIE